MGAQVRLVGKRLSTLGAFKGLLPRVGPDVSLEQPRATEPFPAVWTSAALIVRAHMHAVSWRGDVQLIAVWALAGLFVVGTSVRLSVPGQVARCAVRLAAIGARVDGIGSARGRVRIPLVVRLRRVESLFRVVPVEDRFWREGGGRV